MAVSRPEYSRRSIVAFVVVVFAWSWSCAFAFVAAGTVVRRGEGWPTHAAALAGPALAALIVVAWAGGRRGMAALGAGVVRWRMSLRWWAATLSPLGFLAVALAVAALVGRLPAPGDFGYYTGLPAAGVVAVFVLALVVNGFGEEIGWRGFLQPALQERVGALHAALVIAPIWALWHLPFFFLLSSYRGFGPFEVLGFLVGITSGAIVLAWLYNGTGGSILAVALWHTLYNMASGTLAGEGIVAGVVSGLVIALAVELIRRERQAHRNGTRPVLGPRAPEAGPSTGAGQLKRTGLPSGSGRARGHRSARTFV